MSSDIVYRPAEKKDEQGVLEFLREHFYTDEPLSKNDGYHDTEDEDFAIGLIIEGTSTVADLNGQIIGVRLAYPNHKDEQVSAAFNKTPTTAYERLFGFVNILETKSKVFERYQVDSSMQGHMLGVRRDLRGQGIAKRLLEENMKLAKEKGFSVYVCDCSSLFSARLCEKVGMEQTATMEFNEYCDENGNPYYNPDPPHDLARSYAKRL
ncbi:hypothetical protein ACFFRR_011113 [Megaselia abdita]